MRVPRLILSPLAATVLLAVGAQSASAECRNVYKYVPYPPYGDLVLECDNATPPKGGKPKKPKAKREPKPPTRRQLAALRYKPRASVTETLKPELIARLAKGEFGPQIQAQIQAGGQLKLVDANIRKLGWSTRDLGDRYAHAFILTWLLVNNKTKVSSAVDRAVRKDLKARLARGKWSKWSDARQQEYGERLSSYMAVLNGIHNTYKKANESTRASLTRYDANDLSRSRYFFGKSMFLVKLTRKGVID